MASIWTATSCKTVVWLVVLSTRTVVSMPVLLMHLDLMVCSQHPTYSRLWIPTGSHSWVVITLGVKISWLVKLADEEICHCVVTPVTTLTLVWVVTWVTVFLLILIWLVYLTSSISSFSSESSFETITLTFRPWEFTISNLYFIPSSVFISWTEVTEVTSIWPNSSLFVSEMNPQTYLISFFWISSFVNCIVGRGRGFIKISFWGISL